MFIHKSVRAKLDFNLIDYPLQHGYMWGYAMLKHKAYIYIVFRPNIYSLRIDIKPEIMLFNCTKCIQSTLVISKSKGPSKTVRGIRTSTYQICSIEEKTI